jgi:hypothetical protein
MDIGTAFLLGVLVGQWVLLFAIWRGVAKLLRLIAELESMTKEQEQVLEIQPSRPKRHYSRDDF